jgi:hypothetical protein
MLESHEGGGPATTGTGGHKRQAIAVRPAVRSGYTSHLIGGDPCSLPLPSLNGKLAPPESRRTPCRSTSSKRPT